jgi:hypothetical protein
MYWSEPENNLCIPTKMIRIKYCQSYPVDSVTSDNNLCIPTKMIRIKSYQSYPVDSVASGTICVYQQK